MAKETSLPIFISQVQLKNFRCFTHLNLDFSHKIVLIEGANGMGKTSLLEALHYACYLRSFRTHLPKELVQFGHDNFFMQVALASNVGMHEMHHAIQIGFSRNKKLVKVDQKPISSYKQLMDTYRVVSLTEHDLELVQASPQARRSFMDQALLLVDPEYLMILKTYRTILDQRNALLSQRTFDRDSYEILTSKLWEQTNRIQDARINALAQLGALVAKLAHSAFDIPLQISLTYAPKYEQHGSLQDFTLAHPMLYDRELRFGRSLFGAHLDDVMIQFDGQKAKQFASRGQQKLIVLLIKIAQAIRLKNHHVGGVMLLDDFMTDFDNQRSEQLVHLLDDLDTQLIFTSPGKEGFLHEILVERGAQLTSIP